MPNFSEMSDIAKICIILAAVLLVLLIVLIVVTIKVLKKPDDVEYVEKRYGEKSEVDPEERTKKSQEDVDALIRDLQETADSVPSASEEEDEEETEDEDEENEAEEAAPETKELRGEENTDIEAETEEEVDEEKVDEASDDEENDDEENDDEEESDEGHTTDLNLSAIKKALLDSATDDEEEEDDAEEEISDSAFGPEVLAREKEERDKSFETTFDSAFVQVKQEVVEEKKDEVAEDTTAEENAEAKDTADEDKAEVEEEAAEDKAEAEESTAENKEAAEAEDTVDEEKTENAEKKGFFVRKKIEEEPITVNPVNSVNFATVNSEGEVETKNETAGIGSASEMKEFLRENPVPKKKKLKISKKEKVYEEKFGLETLVRGGKYFWYNSQDIEDLKKKEDMYFHCHYFEEAEEVIGKLIVEMYDCGFVRTEEIQKIAFGVEFHSMNLQEILRSKENVSFDADSVTKEPTEEDEKLIYEKWCGYVDNFMNIIVIQAPDEVKEQILDALYEYGHNDADVLIYSPE